MECRQSPGTLADELPQQSPDYRLSRLFRRCARPAAWRAPLPRLCRPRTHRRALPACGVALARRAEERRDLVLQRLSRHGPASQGDRRHGRDRDADGHRRRRHPQHRRQQSSAGRARARACRSAPQGSGAGLHLRLRLQRNRHLDAGAADAELPDPVGCLEPQFDDRRRAPGALREADLPPQRHGASRRAVGGRRSAAAEAHRVREPLFDGWRRGAGQRHLRPRRALRRHDLYRRGARGRHVRTARRRHQRARRTPPAAST